MTEHRVMVKLDPSRAQIVDGSEATSGPSSVNLCPNTFTATLVCISFPGIIAISEAPGRIICNSA
jgi:hypothetical protein